MVVYTKEGICDIYNNSVIVNKIVNKMTSIKFEE